MLPAAGTLLSATAVIASAGDPGYWAGMQWMTWRAGLQTVAFLLTMLALFDLR